MVDTVLTKFILCHTFSAFYAGRIGLPKGKVTGCVLIEERIVKEDAAYHQFNDQLSYIRYKGIETYPIFNRNEQQLADEYDKAIEELRAEGKIAELELKYFGESLSDYLK